MKYLVFVIIIMRIKLELDSLPTNLRTNYFQYLPIVGAAEYFL